MVEGSSEGVLGKGNQIRWFYNNIRVKVRGRSNWSYG